ncbi:hypothetical protein D3C77_527030 [compost metagenome]
MLLPGRRIYIRNDHFIGLAKRPAKSIQKEIGPRIALWLKYGDNFFPCGLGCSNRRFNFGRMVSVIINDQNALLLPEHLETPFGAMEMLNCFSYSSKRNSCFQTNDDCGHGIVDVVLSWNGELDLP